NERAGGRRRGVKAVVLAAPNRFELRDDVDDPRPGRGQARVRVRATTMCGTDQKIFAGQFPGTPYPHIPGHEFAGEVVELGEGLEVGEPDDADLDGGLDRERVGGERAGRERAGGEIAIGD